MSQDYVGFRKQKKKGLGTTLSIVAAIHLVIGGGLVWLAYTQVGQEWLKVYKIKIAQVKEKEPPPPEPPPPQPEPPKPEPQKAEPEAPPPPPPAPVEAAKPVEQTHVAANQPVTLPSFGNPFATGGRKGRFAGYVDLVTSEIQKRYKQPPDLSTDIEYVVLCQLLVDEEGRVQQYQLVNSSGNKEFDQSALEALAAVERLRPPPPGMSKIIVVKFFPPS